MLILVIAPQTKNRNTFRGIPERLMKLNWKKQLWTHLCFETNMYSFSVYTKTRDGKWVNWKSSRKYLCIKCVSENLVFHHSVVTALGRKYLGRSQMLTREVEWTHHSLHWMKTVYSSRFYQNMFNYNYKTKAKFLACTPDSSQRTLLKSTLNMCC
jgi:hypothetical protein